MSDAWWESAPIVDVQPNHRVFARRVARSVTLVAALARVWWPLWVPVVVLGLVGFGWAAAVVAVVATAVGLGLCRARARVFLAGLLAASVVAVFRWRWPRTCALASIAVAVDGAVRFPKLVSVELSGAPRWKPWRPTVGRLVVKPLGIQDKDSWPRIAARLGQTLDFAVATPRPSDTLLEIAVRRSQLPEVVVVGVDVPTEAVAPDASHIHFGDSALGETIRWALDDPTRPHMLVAGGTGGGKGNAARVVLLWAWLMLHRGQQLQVMVANPKMAGEFKWCSRWAAVASTTGGIVAQILYATEQMNIRGPVCLEYGVDHFNELPPEVQAQLGGRLVFILDEWSDFITNPFLPDAKQVMGLVVSLVRKGRSLGINLMGNGQHVTGELFSPPNTTGNGTAMIGSMTTRLAVGSIEASGAKVLFGSESVAALANGDIPGRGLARGMGSRPGGPDAVPAQVWLVPRDLVMGLGDPTDEVARPPAFDEIAAAKAAKAAAAAAEASGGDGQSGRRRRSRVAASVVDHA